MWQSAIQEEETVERLAIKDMVVADDENDDDDDDAVALSSS